jgi:hypothetical protein
LTRIRPYGAYGLRLGGIDREFLARVPSRVKWPGVSVSREVTTPAGGPERIDREAADVPLLDGDRAVIRRRARSATLLTSAPEDDGRILHPFLTAAAVIFAWWDGRHAFHGGAFVGSNGAWGVLGAGASGKSSTLARISLAGLTVLSDDLLVAARGRVLTGPRCVDLRHEAAESLGVGAQAVPVRGGERLRLALAPAPAEVPLCGWLFLSWGDAVDLRRLRPSERLLRLSAQRSTATVLSPSLLELAGIPAWELRRPASWDSLEPAVERVLDLVHA